jgi:hypothetical protein
VGFLVVDENRDDPFFQDVGELRLLHTPRRPESVRADQRHKSVALPKLRAELAFPVLSADNSALLRMIEKGGAVPLLLQPPLHVVGGSIILARMTNEQSAHVNASIRAGAAVSGAKYSLRRIVASLKRKIAWPC